MQRYLVGLRLWAILALMGAGASQRANADLYVGSGTTGFGGPIGNSQMTWTDNGSSVSVAFTKGTGANFNDVLVLYLDTGATGRSTIGNGVNDRADAHRSAISYIEDGASKVLSFPAGFEASHAIAINSSFGGLWSIPSAGSVGNNGLAFVSAVGNPTSAAAPSFNFSFSLASLGLTPYSGATLQFVATYLNPFGDGNGLGFVSNEGYGSGFPGGGSNIGQNDFAFSGSPLTYVTAVPETSSLLFGAVACSVVAAGVVVRRRGQRSALRTALPR